MKPLSVAVISDPHYYSKQNWVETDPYKFPPKREQQYRRGSEEIIKYVFDELCKDGEPDIVLINGDLTNNGEITSHEEMRELLRSLKQRDKKVYVTTATHDYRNDGKSYGFDNDNNQIEVPAFKREDLYDYYYEFGMNEALSIHMPSMCYTAQLADGYRLLALNDDHGKSHAGFTDDCFEWIKEQVKKAKNDGQFIVAMTHHPILTPSPLYKLIAPNDMLEDGEKVAGAFADMGIPCVFTGHSHIHNISYQITDNGNIFYDVSTSSLVGYPPFYRHAVFDPDNFEISVTSTLVENVESLETGSDNLPDFLEKLFLGTVEDILTFAQTDYEKFTNLAIGFSLQKEKAYKLKPIIQPVAKYLNNLTFKRIWRITKKQNDVSKAEIRLIESEPVVPYVTACVANLYKGDAHMDVINDPDKGERKKAEIKFKVATGLLKKLDKLTKPFSKALKKHGIDSIYSVAMPLIKSQKDISDSDALLKY